MSHAMSPSRVVVPWGMELVEADVLRVTGTPPFVQVHLTLAADPAVPDPEGPVQFVLHASELPPDAVERLCRDRVPGDPG